MQTQARLTRPLLFEQPMLAKAFAFALFLAVMALRYVDQNADDAVLVLNTVPIAIVAVDFGWESGLIAAGFAFAAMVFWATIRPELTPVGYVTGATTYFGTAWLVGALSDRLRTARLSESQLARRTAILETEQEDRSRRAVTVERGRLARELHDVVAHSLSIVTVQSAGARLVIREDPDRAVEAISAIERSGREALVELRRLLVVLRTEGAPPAALETPPTLQDLPSLLKEVDRAGVHADLRIEGEPRPLPAALALSAYRIVQEALTNTMKHVGECHAQVTVRYSPESVELDVLDDGGGFNGKRLRRNGRAGTGLIGMRERAALFGGEFDAGQRPGGGYRVHARLPLE
jgi:signal transduction histidine kinase